MGERLCFRSRQVWILILALLLSSVVTSGKYFPFLVPQFSHMKMEMMKIVPASSSHHDCAKEVLIQKLWHILVITSHYSLTMQCGLMERV